MWHIGIICNISLHFYNSLIISFVIVYFKLYLQNKVIIHCYNITKVTCITIQYDIELLSDINEWDIESWCHLTAGATLFVINSCCPHHHQFFSKVF